MSDPISGVILSGGEGRRMGGADKGLQLLNGRPLVAHVVARIAPQVHELVINANRHREAYLALGYPVVADSLLDETPEDAASTRPLGAPVALRSAGPLAGMLAGFGAATHALLLFVPCDMPALPADLAHRLLDALLAADADLAIAATAGNAHHVVLLARRKTQTHLAQYVAAGGRKAGAWHTGLKSTVVNFDDEPAAFVNVNTSDDLAALAHKST